MADMTTKILTVEIDADKAINGIVNLNNAIDKNTQQIKANNAMIAENNKAMQQEGADAMALAAQNQKLAQSNVELEAKTRELKDEKRALMKETQNEIKMQTQAEGSLKSLRAQLSNLTKQYDSLSKAERQNEQVGGALLKQINSVTTEIKTAEEETQRYFRNVGNYPETAESVKGALRSMQDEIINLTMEYRQMSDEMQNSEAGQAMKQRIEELTQKASEYKDAMSDVKQSIREGASDTRGLDTAIQAGQTLAATFGLANNAAVALGISTDGLQKAMLKMQQAMQAVQALQVIQNALQKQSNLMRGIAIVQSKAAAAAARIEAAATASATGATKAQTVAQAAFNAVANANPYILLATAILTVIGLIVGYTSATKEATEADKESAEAAKMHKESVESLSQAYANAVADPLVKLEALRKEWIALGDDLDARRKFIKQNQKDLEDVASAAGIAKTEVSNFNGVNKMLVTNTDPVVQAIKRRALAMASLAEATRLTQIKLQEIDKVWQNAKFATAKSGQKAGAAYTGGNSKGGISPSTGFTKEELEAAMRSGGTTQESEYGGAVILLNQKGAEIINKMRNKSTWENAERQEKEITERFDKRINKMLETYVNDKNYSPDGFKSAPISTSSSASSSKTKKSGKSTTTTTKSNNEQVKSEKELQDMLLNVIVDAYNARAKVGEKYTAEWVEEQKAAINEEYKKSLQAMFDRQAKEEAEYLKAKKAGKISAKEYADYMIALSQGYAILSESLNSQLEENLKKVDDEVEKHRKEQEEKAKKDAEDALKNAKEQADKRVQTMIDSFSEGSQERMLWRMNQLRMQFAEELKLWEGNEQMKVAIQRKYEQESEQVANEYLQHQMELQQQKYEAFGKIAGGLSQLFGEFADESKEAAILQKSLATAEVMLAQAVAIANAIKAAAMGSINPWQMIAQIATSVTAVTIAMVQAFKSLDKAKFATGGYISGAGTGTSDSIPVRVSNGESIINANSTAMFSGLLSSLNQLGGGVPIQATSTAQTVQGEDMLARAFARGVAMLPNPVVSVQDINDGQRQVQVMTERATL